MNNIIQLYSISVSFRLMRKARYLLDRDLKDKFNAQSIDEHAIDLNLTSPSLYLKEGVTHINPRYVIINFYACILGKKKRIDYCLGICFFVNIDRKRKMPVSI